MSSSATERKNAHINLLRTMIKLGLYSGRLLWRGKRGQGEIWVGYGQVNYMETIK